MSKQKIQLSDHFTYPRLLRFVLPAVGTMLFTSIYGIVDGLCVSNFVGKTAFAAVNLIMPLPQLLATIGFMLGTGGSALVSYTLGTGDKRKANEIFSLLIYVLICMGLVFTVAGEALLMPVSRLLGADETMLPYCVRYGRIVLLGLVPFMLQNTFQSFLVTAERPHFGLYITIIAGVANMVLDALLVGVWKMGVEGAALATIISQCLGGLIPLIYFLCPNKSPLRLLKAPMDWRAITKASTNGASEFMTNISMSIVTMLYNWQLMRLMGSDGVAVFGIIMYVNFIFISIFLGYSMGSAPIVSYHYGARNHAELNNLYSKSLRLIGVIAVVMTALSMLVIPYVARIFVGYDAELLALTSHAFRVYALNFFLMGFNVYGSSFFTALGDGVTSALISFLRTLLFQLLALIFLPMVLGIEGVWLAVTAAEAGALCVTVLMFITKDKVFHYRKVSC